MIMTSEDRDALTRLPIPDSDGLIVGGRENPRMLAMKRDRSNVIQMTMQGEQTSPLFVVPDLDLIIISTRDEKRLARVESNTTDGSIMFVEPFDESTHLKIPHLNTTRMKGGGQEGQFGMESDSLDPIGFRFELSEHLHLEQLGW